MGLGQCCNNVIIVDNGRGSLVVFYNVVNCLPLCAFSSLMYYTRSPVIVNLFPNIMDYYCIIIVTCSAMRLYPSWKTQAVNKGITKSVDCSTCFMISCSC